MMKNWLRVSRAFTLAALLLLAGIPAFAGTPSAPQLLNGKFQSMNNSFDLVISWFYSPANEAVDLFEIYQADSKTDDLTKFTKVGELTKAQFDTTGFRQGLFFWYNLGYSAGSYSFYIVGSNSDGKSPASNILHISTSSMQDAVLFTSSPDNSWKAGIEYVYDADAKSVLGGTVKYKAINIPSTATLDETTGELRYTYTGTTSGHEIFTIEAYLESDATVNAQQTWMVRFIGDSTGTYPRICTIVQGTVTDQSGNPVTGGVVSMMQWMSNGTYGAVSATSISAKGTYTLYSKLSGKFTLEISGQYFEHEYFEDASDIANATVFNTQCGDTVTANFVVQAKSAVWFTSAPSYIGDPATEYVYQPTAASNNNGVIKFKALNVPNGTTFDETTGELRYTYSGATAGSVSFKIAAYLESDSTIYDIQSWSVRFKQSNPVLNCMQFYGTVKDEQGNPITSGYVMAYYFDARIGYKGGVVHTVMIDNNGNYVLPIFAAGTYVLYVGGSTFTPEFYQDTDDIQNATQFTVQCGDSTEVNFTVGAIEKYVISGTVTDMATNLPVESIVTAYSGKLHSYQTTTDASGNYSLTVTAGSSYYVKAKDINGNYYTQFYDHATSETAAASLVISADMSNINFELEAQPVRNNGISGTIQDENGNPLEAFVFAYKINYRGTSPYIELSYFTETDSTGYFEFKNLDPGEYVLHAFTKDRFVPGYYKENAIAVTSWINATTVTVTDNGTITGIVFTMKKVKGIQGSHILHGNVRGRIHTLTSNEAPLKDVSITLVDANGDVSDYATSDESGNYMISNAASGTYTLIADAPGYQTLTESVELDYTNGDALTKGLLLEPYSVTSASTLPAVVSGIAVSLYPNPVSDAVQLTFAEDVSDVTIAIYNTLGMAVRTMSYNALSSGSTVSMQTAGLNAGAYFVKITSNAQHITLPVQVVR